MKTIILALSVASTVFLGSAIAYDNPASGVEPKNCPIGDNVCERTLTKAMAKYDKQRQEDDSNGSAWNMLWIGVVIYLIYRRL